jgi:conjugative relaxase-like TrwC/TraI family protein
MLSLSKLTSSAGASSYFEVDDYYTKEEAQVELERTTSFQGELAKELQLPNFVDKQTFKDLLDGKVNGKGGNLIQELKQASSKTGESIRSAGTDMTFSAPKSLSILAEVLGKEELSKIHDNAVSKTLSYIERNLITTQIREGSSSNENSKITLEQTTKALFATFKHNTSRNLDPQLHTHAIAINITKREKETKYRSTEFKKIFENKLLLGAIYRAELAKDLINQGYEIHQTNIDGRFEIKNFPTDLMEKFSTRRAEIEKVLAQIGKDDAKSSATVALNTRHRKVQTRKEILQAEWHNTAKDYDLSNLQNTKNSITQTEPTTKDLINHSISILTEKESAFTKESLLKQTLINNIEKGTTITELEKEIQNMLKERTIIQVFQNNKTKKDGILYTTKQEIHRELQLIKHLETDTKNKQIFTSKEELQNQIHKNDNIKDKYNLLTDGQKEAVNHILTSKEQIIGIQGSAGTGKTYMLNIARELLQENGKEFIALAPSSSATKLLKDDANIQNNNTLQHFLMRYQRYQNQNNDKTAEQDKNQTKEYFKNKVIILDEASLVSNKQMLSLINITKTLDIKLILQGDTKQLSSVEAGKPFHQLQQAGMKTVVMSDILRQQNQDLKQAVELTINAQIKQAFQKIQNNIIEVEPNSKDNQTNKPPLEISPYANENPSKEYSHNLQEQTEMQNINTKERIINATLQTYFNLPKEERSKTLILTPANETRNEINAKVREELIKRGELDNTTNTIINTLKSKNISDREKLFSASYEKGDIVIFNKSYKSLNIKADEQLTVKDRDRESIILQKQNDNQTTILPLHTINPKTLEIYTTEAKELLKNEQIRFTKNDKTHNLINSHTAKVMNIDNKENTINLKLENNKTITLPQTELKHFDYAYSSTAYSAQGKTANNVIAVLESYRKNLTNQQTFYVEISRAKNQAFLITDNKEKLQQTLEKQTGEKISVLTEKETTKAIPTQEQNKTPEKDNNIVIKDTNNNIKTKDFDLER